ncbi:MAG: 6,7-dimethyl-8-ribityllumazine synthase [Chromatiales bacterium]|nr:6,7-dimethyl-8-ribityllumazine synthase [Chromatiales bacterium]
MKVIEGQLVVRDARFAVVAARFNELVVARLVDGAVDTLRRHGAGPNEVELVRVPGAWELPIVVRRLAQAGRHDGIVALGTVIRGETPHFDFVCSEAAAGLQRVSLEFGLPVGFGLLTCDTAEQALARAGGKAGNKGNEAALAMLETLNLLRQLEG